MCGCTAVHTHVLPPGAAQQPRKHALPVFANLFLGRSPAGATVTYTITAGNTGARRLSNLTLDIPPWAALQNCTPTLAGPIAVHSSMVCYAEYTFDQDMYEAGALDFVATAKPVEMQQAVTSAPATVTPSYNPALALYQGACSLPTARESGPAVAADRRQEQYLLCRVWHR